MAFHRAPWAWVAGTLLAASLVSAQTAFFPIQDLRPGMRGIGRTVFNGDRIEEFQVEILGVLDNVAPQQSLILARLSGGQIEKAGVMQGMSGSPVYIDGKLVGAVAMGFPFAKEPIAAIRPIGEMVGRATPLPRPAAATLPRLSPWTDSLAAAFPRRPETQLGPNSRLVDIATPVSFSGFTQRTIQQFSPELRALGLEPVQGIAGGSGSRGGASAGAPPRLAPGSMISVQLVHGDMEVGADGTITHVDGQNVYAFGHRFLATGQTELPFARAEVIALVASTNTSFKISAAREALGAITADQNTVVMGQLGRRPVLAPVQIRVRSRSGAEQALTEYNYRFEVVRDRLLTPFLLQMAVFSALDATERMTGTSSVYVHGAIELEGASPIRVENMLAGDYNVAQLASVAVTAPLAYALQSNFESLKVKSIALTLDTFETKKQLQVERLWTSRRELKPGETVAVHAVLVGTDGLEVTRTLDYTVPVGSPTGPLYFTVSDGSTLNIDEYRQLLTTPPRSVTQLISTLNALRANTKAFLRVWRAEPDFSVQGANLPAPPPSLEMILARTQSVNSVPSQNSKIDEMSWDLGDMVVTGARTVQVEVKE